MTGDNFLLAERLSLLEEEEEEEEEKSAAGRWWFLSPETDMQAATNHVHSGDATADPTIDGIKL